MITLTIIGVVMFIIGGIKMNLSAIDDEGFGTAIVLVSVGFLLFIFSISAPYF